MIVRVLMIGGDGPSRNGVATALNGRGLSVLAVPDGRSAIDALQTCPADVVLLNLALPDMDGFALLGALRISRPRLPLIALAGSEDERSKLAAFARGADDYVVAPFSAAELAARIEARLRWRDTEGTLLEAGALTLDLANNHASLGDRSATLSAREGSLLAAALQVSA